MSLAPPFSPACVKTMDTADGQVFIKNLAHFVRTHERALANALQLRRQSPRHASSTAAGLKEANGAATTSQSSVSSLLAAALSLPTLNFASHQVKPAKLSLTPHHLFYLLSRFEELGIGVGPMNVRLESIHAESSAANYVSFLDQSQRRKGRASDRDSIHSVTSLHSVVSGVSSLWSSLGLGAGSSTTAKSEKLKAAMDADLKYLYSAFTKIPCLRLAPDRKAGLIQGYEEFPFDTAVPLWAFKNVSALEISDVDIRQFFGWDRMAEQLRSLTVKRAGVDDPADLLVNIVLDDMDRRRRRSSRTQPSPLLGWTASSPSLSHPDMARSSSSAPGSPKAAAETKPSRSSSPHSVPMVRGGSEGSRPPARPRARSRSGSHPPVPRPGSMHGHVRGSGQHLKRTGSGSSTSSSRSAVHPGGSSSNLLSMVQLPSNKWRFLKHLSLADNGLTSISANSLAPLANTLHSLDLSCNLFAQVPDPLATLTCLRALNLSNCMIDSLRTLTRNPLPAITALNLRSNRLVSLAGIERLPALERVDFRDNRLTDPTELARLTNIPDIHELWVADNPFTRTHPGYRVVIFNLFRSSPGYVEDIVIDAMGPSYGEKKHLVERTVQPAVIPDPIASPGDVDVASAFDSQPATPLPLEDGPMSGFPGRGVATPTGTDEAAPNNVQHLKSRSARRRKGPRRRIVELSRSDIQSPATDFPLASPVEDEQLRARRPRPVEGDTAQRSSTTHPLNHAVAELPRHMHDPSSPANGNVARPTIQTARTMPAPPTSAHEVQDWDVSSEMYRKRVEALRSEVGNGWLSVLNEGGWDHQRMPHAAHASSDFGPAGTVHRSSTTPTPGSHTIVGGGRTLG